MKKLICVVIMVLNLLLLSFLLYSCDNDTGLDLDNDDKNDIEIPVPDVRKYNVTFETNGGTSISEQNASVIQKSPNTTKEDHVFLGWCIDESLNTAVQFPLDVEKDMTLYAKWLRISQTSTCKNTSLKFLDDRTGSATYDISPSDFDLDALDKNGYFLRIEVTYDVYYKKDYDVPFDIGYAGSPKYEVSIYNSDLIGVLDEDMSTSKTTKTRTIKIEDYTTNLKNTKLRLTFSTDNIQNIIYFKNITVQYTCVRYK